MTQSQEAQVVDAVIANAVHHAKLRATPDDVAFGLLHALRLLRDHAEALGASTVGRIDQPSPRPPVRIRPPTSSAVST